MGKYNHRKIERKWQKIWEKEGIYTPDINKAKNKFYNLFMFPYLSAEGLHAGHAFSSTGSDIYGRFMRMNGKDVFQPMGYDSFGIHSENYAIQVGEKPQAMLKRTKKHFEGQLKSLGHGYDWTRTVTTSDPDYYRWTQWLFIQMFKAGLAYKKKAAVNFCPSCKTVLADEQVIDGQCERCQAQVEKKQLEQWFFKITDYADRLLDGLEKIDWSERVKVAQRNWIGKSEGMIIKFGDVEIFTTRPDTLESATFIAAFKKTPDFQSGDELNADMSSSFKGNPALQSGEDVIATSKLYEDEEPHSKKVIDPEAQTRRAARGKEKMGKFTGRYAINPVNGRKLPIWETNYVEGGYGTGVIMGVPAYDERDMVFAKKYGIDIVTEELNGNLWEKIEKKGWGKKQTNYHLRDWLVSRQRYWGAPIPMIFCQKHGWVPVPEEELPVLLPDIKDYKPEGTGKGPLANHPEFYNAACPECGGAARRETDVMDTFVDSSWYFLRYPSVPARSNSFASSHDSAFNREITRCWLPVDLYFGGAEHSVLHLMYARFVTMVLHDRGFIDFNEPFSKFFAHGLMIKDGAKMSKSRGNVVNPDEYISKFGADALRLYLMFMGPMDGSPDFRDTGIEGMRRFVVRVWNLFNASEASREAAADQNQITIKMHQTIKKVTEDIESFKYNTAIAAIMEFVNVLHDASTRSALLTLCLLLAPFAPHMAEEVWQNMKGEEGDKFESIHFHPWPKWDPKLIEVEKVVVVVQVNGKLRSQLLVDTDISKSKTDIEKMAIVDQKISKHIASKQIKKTIFVEGKLLNFVTK